MNREAPRPEATVLLQGADGLRFTLNANGSLRRIDHGALLVNLFPGLEVEGGPANLWLRRRRAGGAVAVPLLGPGSPLPPLQALDEGTAATRGHIDGLELELQLRLDAAETAWCWHLAVRNGGDASVTLDLLHAQDIGLATPGAVRLNEYYVSHYIDFMPLPHARCGTLLAARQNRAVAGCFPWLLTGALPQGGGCVAWATDARQVHGLATRCGAAAPALAAGLPGQRLQHEHAMASLQAAPQTLAPGARARFGFFARLRADHPAASSEADAALADATLALACARPLAVTLPAAPTARPSTLFSSAPWLPAREFTAAEVDALFGTQRRHEEHEDGRLLSFFRGDSAHVVLQAKERRAMRPHGHILRSGAHLVPDETSLASTVGMAGVFHSMVTQGHVGINRSLSTVRSWLGLFRSQGQRLFVRTAAGWWQLGLPSAFEITPQACRWWYRHDGGLIEVESTAGAQGHVLTLRAQVLEGAPLDWLVSHDVCLGGDEGSETPPAPWWREGEAVVAGVPAQGALASRFPQGTLRIEPLGDTRFARAGGDELLWSDGVARAQPFVCVGVDAARGLALRLVLRLVDEAAEVQAAEPLQLPRWQAPLPGGALDALGEALPWMLRDALVHYLAPRGLEQFSGGGWGTRDVCQGPLEMLLALGRPEIARDLLCRVLAAQDAGGDWPQWFMFFEREAALRANDSHGDIVLWPVLAAARYLLASGDAAWLATHVPFHGGAPAPVREHLERALAVARARRIAGTALVAYGHGDWNDSLQPADPALREHLCSAWTVTLHHQALATLARALRSLGEDARADALAEEAEAVAADFRRRLMPDGEVAGYAFFPPDGEPEWMIHPRDHRTGLRASLLPKMHAVLENLLAPDEARHELAVIERELTGPDGARLFDRPLPYRGGIETLFQRAESSAFFGREIGVMYMHAHLRHAEMLAHLGLGERLLQALSQAHPVGHRQRVPAAAPRQANCYYSSSDAAFADRYEADRHYADVISGRVPLDGGWRVYSSGPGILVGIVVERLLGLRVEHHRLVFDPVLPRSLDGLRVQWIFRGEPLELVYRVGAQGCGPQRLRLGAQELAFEREFNPYREGAAGVPRAAFEAALQGGARTLHIELG